MSRRLNIDRTTVMVVVGIAIIVALYAWAVSLAQNLYVVAAPASSTFSSSPVGMKVLFVYLERLGLQPKVLQQVDDLPPGATIIMAGPFQKAPTRSELVVLDQWVRAGGRLVVADAQGSLVMRGLKLGGSPSTGDASETMKPLLPAAYASGVSTVAPGPGRILVDSPAWATHLKGEVGQVLISQLVGEGEVIWLADPYAMSNAGLGTDDNARLATLLAAAGGRPIYFDEYHHGYVRTAGVWDRLGEGGRSAVVLLGIALVILLLAWGRRIGPAVSGVEEQPARGTAYIGSLAELYRKAGARAEALEAVEDGLRRALARTHGTLEAGLARHPSAASALSAAADARASGEISDDRFLSVARQLRSARQEVEG